MKGGQKERETEIETERETGLDWAFETSKSTPSDILSLTRAYKTTCNCSQTVNQLGTKYSHI